MLIRGVKNCLLSKWLVPIALVMLRTDSQKKKQTFELIRTTEWGKKNTVCVFQIRHLFLECQKLVVGTKRNIFATNRSSTSKLIFQLVPYKCPEIDLKSHPQLTFLWSLFCKNNEPILTKSGVESMAVCFQTWRENYGLRGHAQMPEVL